MDSRRTGRTIGPFYSVVAQNGNVIALQITEEKYARIIASLGEILDCDFDVILAASMELYDIMKRDFPDLSEDQYPISIGSNHYVIKAVIEALFGSHNGR